MAYKYTRETVLQAIKGSNGLLTKIAERLGCARSTAEKYVTMWSETKQARRNEIQSILDLAEARLYRRVDEGDSWAIQFILRTLGKDRGFTERSEFTGDFDGEIVFKMVKH